MRMMKRWVAMAMAGALLLSGLTGCGKQGQNTNNGVQGQQATIDNGTWAQRAAFDPEGFDPTTVTDLTEFLLGTPGDTAVATLNGEAITADDVVYWIINNCDSMQNYLYYQTGSSEIPWEADIGNGQTFEEYVLEESMALALSQCMVEQVAVKDEITVTDEQMQEAEKLLVQIEAEGKALLNMPLERYLKLYTTLDPERFLANYRADIVYKELMNARFSGDNAPTEEAILEWLAEQNAYRSKHILISTMDAETGKTLDKEAVAEKKRLAEGLVNQLLDAEDPIALFDELMHQYSEDPGLATNPDGYVARPGEMVQAYEEMALALDEGDYSDPVQSEYGFHIILRLPLEIDPKTYENDYIQDSMGQLVKGWLEQAEIAKDPQFAQLDVKDVFARMAAYRSSIATAAQ